MTKYWTPERVKKERDKSARRQQRVYERAMQEREKEKTYTPGDVRKNTRLMLDALGLPIRRKMLALLNIGGDLSVTTLADPFNITLPPALMHVRILERAGLITTYKRGRVRFCSYKVGSVEELARFLTKGVAFLT